MYRLVETKIIRKYSGRYIRLKYMLEILLYFRV